MSNKDGNGEENNEEDIDGEFVEEIADVAEVIAFVVFVAKVVVAEIASANCWLRRRKVELARIFAKSLGSWSHEEGAEDEGIEVEAVSEFVVLLVFVAMSVWVGGVMLRGSGSATRKDSWKVRIKLRFLNSNLNF